MQKTYTSIEVLLFFTVLFTACEKYFAEEEENISKPTTGNLRITPRSNDDATIPYPINIYAFNSEGVCSKTQKISSAEENPISLSLPQGDYRIVVLAGATEESYNIPQAPILTDVIEMKQGYQTDNPLMTGTVNVTLKSGTTKANINLTYAVAQLNVTLSNIPNEYSDVKVDLASFFSQLGFNGTYADNSHKISAVCRRNTNGDWITGTFYTFGNAEKSTIISVHLTKGENTETYGYTYKNSIEPGCPFILKGNYSGSFVFEGNIIVGNWSSPTTIDFNFGKGQPNEGEKPNNTPEGDSNGKQPDGTFTVSQIPTEESIWNGGLVIKAIPVAENNATDLLLMGINNALNTKGSEKMKATDVQSAIKAYTTTYISNWRIPTMEEVELLKEKYNENLDNINRILLKANGTPLELEKPRYLCNDGKNSFNFKSNTISPSGQTTTYYLRPVSTIRIIKE